MLQDPLLSFARRSRRALRRLRGEMQRTGRVLTADAEARQVAAAFDAGFYLAMNPDVAHAGVDPVSHFLQVGWREGRDPTPGFSVRDYIELNPEVAAADQNPFAHYLRNGRAEGLVAKRDPGFRYEIIHRLEPLETRLARARRHWETRRATRTPRLAKALAVSRSGFTELHISVSHDNYAVNIGGVQLCVQREARALADQGVDHLHLFPADIYPTVRAGPEASLLGVLWNGALAGYFRPSTVAAALADAFAAVPHGRRSFALHSLLGHAVEDILGILQAAGPARGFFWIHDFASLCAGFHLSRNDVAACGAPPPGSAACQVCLYGGRRGLHMAEHARLFVALDLTVVAPSDSALSTWTRGVDLPHRGEIVLPHAVLRPSLRPARPAGDGPVTIAFAGVPTAHKGWPVFHALAARFQDDPRYRFVQLGRPGVRYAEMGFREVTVSVEHPLAMREALEAEGVDIALIWPLCEETFSFTAFEAIAAGAAILTNPDSGNVAALAGAGGHGRVLADEAALTALFESEEVLNLARAHRLAARYDLVFSALTAELRAGPAIRRAS